MADTFRHRWGDQNKVKLAVNSATVIEIGDLLWWDSANSLVKNAGAQTDQLTATSNQVEFRNKFAGVALERSRSGDTDPVSVATTGVFEFPCASATFAVGDLIAATETSGGDALEDQKVVAVGANRPFLAIGRVAEAGASVTTVKVALRSTLFGPSVGDVKYIRQRFTKADMTDGGGTSGTINLTPQIPANSLVLGWTGICDSAFSGDTSATVQVGVSGTADAFSAVTTNSVFASGTVGCGVKASNAGSFRSAATTVLVTITSNADFTNVAAGGAMELIIAYLPL